MSKEVIILRGPSGAGKTRWINDTFSGVDQVCSADHFFYVCSEETGQLEYRFDITKIAEAHAACLRAFLESLHLGKERIVVDNTNTHHWEYDNYVIAADMMGYHVRIVEIVPKTLEEIRIVAARNQHGTPAATVARMMMEFEFHEDAEQVEIKK